MSDNQLNNKRIAKNTLLLYIRMAINMVVGLYTSRVVLQTLGVEDYGIYGVVGGIVAFLGFLNNTMAGATSRFLAFELGKGDGGKLKDTFVSSVWVHVLIAIIILILAETLGLWFFYNKLVIPEARIEAAFWVFQFSIAAAMISITQVPYNASVISHENMDVFAYVEIINVFLKLGIVFLLLIIPADKLITYSALFFIVSFGVAFYYRWYCVRHYEECRLSFSWKSKVVKKMLSFCAWDLYGTGCAVGKQQGINFLVNMFFGVTLNAGISIAATVNGSLSGFTRNILTAIKPPIIKSYAQNDIPSMQNLMILGIKSMVLLQACFSIPIILEADYILNLWLGTVPPYAVIFCQLMLSSTIVAASNGVLTTAIHATGNIRRLSFISGTIVFAQIPILYYIYKLGGEPYWAYLLGVLDVIILLVVNTSIIKRNIPSISSGIILRSMVSVLAVVMILALPSVGLLLVLPSSLLRLILTLSLYIVLVFAYSYIFVLPKSIKDKINSRLHISK